MKKILAFAALFLWGCQIEPYTNRQQFILLSPAEDRALGAQAYQETLAKSKLLNAGPQADAVRRVGARIAPIADELLRERGQKGFAWEFSVIEADTVNAWCLPGGKVAFYTGILPICKDDTGIAVVMGHEIGHAIARHGAERISAGLGIELVNQLLQSGLAKSKQKTQEAVLAAFGISAGLGSLAHGRTQESASDHIGLMLMAEAGYDPRESVHFWQRMAAQGKSGTPEFLSTHPSDATRIADLQQLLPQALAIYEQRQPPKLQTPAKAGVKK